jgi:hypothetical protein
MFKLTLAEGEWSYRNHVRERIISYQVNGMPDGQKAYINIKSGNVLEPRWALLRVKNGISGDWYGDYKTADEALAAFQEEVDEENAQRRDAA